MFLHCLFDLRINISIASIKYNLPLGEVTTLNNILKLLVPYLFFLFIRHIYKIKTLSNYLVGNFVCFGTLQFYLLCTFRRPNSRIKKVPIGYNKTLVQFRIYIRRVF